MLRTWRVNRTGGFKYHHEVFGHVVVTSCYLSALTLDAKGSEVGSKGLEAAAFNVNGGGDGSDCWQCLSSRLFIFLLDGFGRSIHWVDDFGNQFSDGGPFG